MKQLLAVEIPLPQPADQRTLASRLDRISSHSTRAAERSKQADLLSDALEVAYVSRSDLIDASKLRRGWQRKPLGSLMALCRDRVDVEAGKSYPNLGIYSFGRGLFEKPPIESDNSSAKQLNRVRAGQFIYSRLFAFEGAYAYVGPAFDNHYVSNEFPTFDVDPEQLDARWLAVYLRSRDRWMELANTSKGLGVRRQRVPIDSVLSYEVLLPPLAEQRKMVEAVDVIESTRSKRASSSQLLEALMPAALNKTFSAIV